ncbi:MAG: hypothetical protein RLZZ352_516 [Pseudomonadota bacterium]|jgi:hypothetical protein
MDALTGGAFSAPTSGERSARIRDWLATNPTLEQMNDVFKELSQRDRGAAKPLKEKLDEIKRQKSQEQIGVEWAKKAEALLNHSRLNLADALAWQRDAARAGAPLSREPLAALKQALAERVKAIEDLQHRVQVEREAAVLIAQRIEVLSTKPWREAQSSLDALRQDVAAWQQQAHLLTQDAQWSSVEPKFPPMLEASVNQLQLVWDAFEAALQQTVAADADPQAPLPAVPVWADELRVARGGDVAAAEDKSTDTQAQQEKRSRAQSELDKVLSVLERELAEGHGKAAPKAAAELRTWLKAHGRWLAPEQEARAHAALKQAGELEGWQRWRADQLREELVAKAEALLTAPEGQRVGGRKMQETLRSLREQWKTTDQGGQPNHALWKRFDEACTEAHKVVEVWLTQVRQQAEAHKAQRLGIIEALKTWTAEQAENTDWKAQLRSLQGFAERWRDAGHLSEKAFTELQQQWKQAWQAAHARLEAAQAESTARRRALIDEAVALGAAPVLRLDAVKALQQRWQAEAHAVPLDRKHEQKLWEAFRQPIDDAFARKSAERDKAAAALNEHDQRVLTAARALEAATEQGDAQQIRAAMAALEQAMQAPATPAAAVDGESASTSPVADAADTVETTETAPAPAAASAPATPAKKLVAMRGDDRPGMKKAEPTAQDSRGKNNRDSRDQRGRSATAERIPSMPRSNPRDIRDIRDVREPRGPRLGDAAFRAQRQALELAQTSLRKLAEQAHGTVLTQLMQAWETRDAQQLPTVQDLGTRVSPSVRAAWVAALNRSPNSLATETLLRLEMASEVPTPAECLSDRRLLQLQLLTRRNAPSPSQTWAEDVATVLSSSFNAAAARRLQQVLKVLLKR